MQAQGASPRGRTAKLFSHQRRRASLSKDKRCACSNWSGVKQSLAFH